MNSPTPDAARLPLQNRVAIVTGGTGALGQAVTLRFLTEGAIVAVPYSVEAEAVHLRERAAPVGRDRLVAEPVDVTDLAAMTAFVERSVAARGRVDILVGAVGGFAAGALLETDATAWRRMLDLNLTSAFAALKALVRLRSSMRFQVSRSVSTSEPPAKPPTPATRMSILPRAATTPSAKAVMALTSITSADCKISR